MLSGQNKFNKSGIERFLPLIRSDGTLALMQMKVDEDFAHQIKKQLIALKIGSKKTEIPPINQLLIESVDISQKDLCDLFECFEYDRYFNNIHVMLPDYLK